MEWRISRAIAEWLLTEAAANPDAEICGLLFGREGCVTYAASCRNVAADPSNSFEIDPASLIAAQKVARKDGPKVAGCYHSHPNGQSAPSLRDAECALPGLWIIVADGCVHGWQHDGEGRFEAAPIRRISALSADSP